MIFNYISFPARNQESIEGSQKIFAPSRLPWYNNLKTPEESKIPGVSESIESEKKSGAAFLRIAQDFYGIMMASRFCPGVMNKESAKIERAPDVFPERPFWAAFGSLHNRVNEAPFKRNWKKRDVLATGVGS